MPWCPCSKELIRRAGEQGCKEAVIGMAHRGRLNVLINVLGKRAQDLFDEFAGKHGESWGTGDVKYHMGFSSDFATRAATSTWRSPSTRLTSRSSTRGHRLRACPYGPSR